MIYFWFKFGELGKLEEPLWYLHWHPKLIKNLKIIKILSIQCQTGVYVIVSNNKGLKLESEWLNTVLPMNGFCKICHIRYVHHLQQMLPINEQLWAIRTNYMQQLKKCAIASQPYDTLGYKEYVYYHSKLVYKSHQNV